MANFENGDGGSPRPKPASDATADNIYKELHTIQGEQPGVFSTSGPQNSVEQLTHTENNWGFIQQLAKEGSPEQIKAALDANEGMIKTVTQQIQSIANLLDTHTSRDNPALPSFGLNMEK